MSSVTATRLAVVGHSGRAPSALPRRTAGRSSSCPEPERPVTTLDDVNLLRLVLDGLHDLDSEGTGR